jgi:sulfatase modifying factor 1
VTNEQYCRFLNEVEPEKKQIEQWVGLGESWYKEKNRLLLKKGKYTIEQGRERHPVICVSWHGAQAYAKWAGCRLPSEVEWEKAARGTEGWKYPWGNEFKEDACNYGGKYNGTTEVGRFENGKSPYGCFDMAGNVWEWCADWFSDGNERNLNNPVKGPDKGKFRVLRGGCWLDVLSGLRCAFRSWDYPDLRYGSAGFRCVR